MTVSWSMVDDERRDFVALAESLSSAEWDARSLCSDWLVRDIVDHVVRQSTPSGPAGPTVAALIDRLRATIGATMTAGRSTAADVLLETLVHQQDIRRPLGLVRMIPHARLRACLDHCKSSDRPNHTKQRIVGLRLFALDMDWSHGTGAEVKGTAEQLLMVMMGRMSVVGELEGMGKGPLAQRD